tara:strand:- start:2741 stop:3385 length:645 start_codon:yes stop_codon:yes gene_type:complete
MSEESQIISNEENKKDFRRFFFNNKKSVLTVIIIFLVILFSYFFYQDYKKKIKLSIADKYNLALINYEKNNPSNSITEMKNIINAQDSTYSPLALYFLLDNNLINESSEINKYFDILINEVNLDDEIRYLIIYKKGLYNSNKAKEDELLNIFKPLINDENIWKSHSLYIIAEYFFSKNERQKSKEFFEKILEMKNPNPKIKIETQKRLQKDLSE